MSSAKNRSDIRENQIEAGERYVSLYAVQADLGYIFLQNYYCISSCNIV